jgi:hypothetical protein
LKTKRIKKKKEKFVPKKDLTSTAREDKVNTVEESQVERSEVIEDQDSKVSTLATISPSDSASNNQNSKRSFLEVVKKNPNGTEKN